MKTKQPWVLRGFLAMAVILNSMGIGHATDIPLGNVSLLVLSPVNTSITSATLVKWRAPGSSYVGGLPPSAAAMTFQWLTSGHTSLPIKALDHTSNNEGTAQSDNAIALTYVKGNTPGGPGSGIPSILMYTDTPDAGSTADPLYNVNLRGGLVGGAGGTTTDPGRQSVLPLSFKAATLSDLVAVSTANVDNGGTAIPSTNRVAIYAEVDSPTGGTCSACPSGSCLVADYGAGNPRSTAGFCDFAQVFDVDDQNYAHNTTYCGSGRWFTDYLPSNPHNTTCNDPVSYGNAYAYSTEANWFGVPLDEARQFYDGVDSTMYFVMGVNFASALRTTYTTTVKVNTFTD